MIDTCFICCKKKELSLEHIIPQCLGGTLKKRLYCTKCNSKLGHDIDVELARNFGRYATLINVGRERGKNQPFNVVDENSGLPLRFDGKKFSRTKPDIKKDKNSKGELEGIKITARSQQERNKIFCKIAKKYNIDLSLVFSEEVENPVSSSLDEFVLDNRSIHTAVAKIAYGFACWKLPNDIVLSASFSNIRKHLKGESEEQLVSSNYEHGDFMTDNIRPLHKIYLSFNRSDGLVIGYVALFGVFRYTVLLSDTYSSEVEWSGIDYTFHPISQQEVPTNLNFVAPKLKREQVINPIQRHEKILQALQRGMKVIAEHSGGVLEHTDVQRSRHNKANAVDS